MLFLISILNFINIISTEILKNKINLSILESIGMTSRDIEKYLIKKSFIYSISSFVFSIILMILIDSFILRYLFNSFNWAEYKFTIMPLVIVNIANILIGVLFTIYFYKKNTKESLVDRIRDL
ncbi:MAG: FtsX-like permease family protein [Peptoniphilus lacydonensis]|uniref:FtsX-like permease family protein n=1 Tax=Peptoniphilus lacydonensis TaxID=1673725 RepID=UPI0028FEBF64|nr:FtsX-like permease family protein [Peptoniphilus lacydonensis]MDU2115872.1 FtsX-like permease family protein [Peptoniphilus lacydonensis]